MIKSIVTFGVCLLLSLSATAQMTHLVGSTPQGIQKGLEALRSTKERDCRWKAGPESVRPENLAPEVLNFVGQDEGPKVKRLCRGTIECDIKGERWHSDLYLVCGMRETNCDSARKCWTHYLEDKLAFIEKVSTPATGARPPVDGGRKSIDGGPKAPADGDGRD